MTRILTIIALMFATPVAAEEILMECQGAVFRYVEGFFEDSVEVRVDGEWQDYQVDILNDDWSITKHEFKVKDRAIIGEFEAVRATDNDYYPKGTTAKSKQVLDFQLAKGSIVTKYSNEEEETKNKFECEKL